MSEEDPAGSFRSLYSTFGTDATVSLDDVTYLTQTDVKVIARELRLKYYEFFPATSHRRARWVVCSGERKAPKEGGFYFA